jgi:polyisoprenoid-binding protein YceI
LESKHDTAIHGLGPASDHRTRAPTTSARLACLLIALWIPAASAAPRTFSIDGNASKASAHVGKTGIGSFAGHEHTVVAQIVQGEVVLDPENISKSSVDLIVPVRSLKVSPQGEPEGDAAKVEQAMLAPGVLDAARFSNVHFHSIEVRGQPTAPGSYALTIAGELSLHGATRALSIPVQVDVHGDMLTASGKMVLRQTDFGIEPTSVAGGLVKVEDEVTLTFRIGARVIP